MDDAVLAEGLPGHFRSAVAEVNGTTLHYVAGGQGEPLVLLPGWPVTWREFRHAMPLLAERYRVIAVDLRGMNLSAKPADGYDKKTMARDVFELVRHLGYTKAHIAGHDIGSMVAYSYAINHPEAITKLAIMEVGHPDASLYDLKLLPHDGAPNLWWFPLNQLHGLPEQLLAGRMQFVVDHVFDSHLVDRSRIDRHDRVAYARAYDSVDAIRAGNGWFQTFDQDVADFKTYGTVTVPMLGLASPANFTAIQPTWQQLGADVALIDDSGHFLPIEQPEAVAKALADFFG
ncbi:alpha/beta hydrolase [Kribbella sandramycini]|uniref:Alpha/beta hydrolase n=1 Tax=Kribbella sandramycini TaxID=60450 RepID=A0A7Y4NX86_9ACTN|nr:alpha/beta hydrolase [Kribbella sandramycini]MBB6567787.1 pimeloyl-ACP methyl ester carboxylesterase [Kribbella sandramycini]NOL39617.1 alpha/beta hydrolase [Kribbella sandramycini]